MSLENRAIRQRDIIPQDKLNELSAIVVGTGAIGRQVSIQLAAIGVTDLILVDFDTVEEENLAAQGFYEVDLGKNKVEAVADVCRGVNGSIKVRTLCKPFAARHINMASNPIVVVFACVDDMAARGDIAKAAEAGGALFIDGRMAAEVFRVFSAKTPEDFEYYQTTLFSNDEAFPVSCTAKTTIYCANVVAGMMIAQLTKHMRGIPLDRDFQLNLLTNTMTYASELVEQEEEVG